MFASLFITTVHLSLSHVFLSFCSHEDENNYALNQINCVCMFFLKCVPQEPTKNSKILPQSITFLSYAKIGFLPK